MNRTICLASSLFYWAIGASPALAHPGDHAGFGWSELAAYLFEPDHLIFILLIIVVGILASGAGRRSANRARGQQ